MAVRVYNAVSEASCDAIVDLVDGGASNGVVRIFTGAQPAINGALTGTVLVEFALQDPAFGAAAASGSGAVATLAGTPISEDAALATGTAGYGAILDSDDNVLWTGTVTASGGGGDFEIDNTSITIGQEVQLTAFTFTVPQTAA